MLEEEDIAGHLHIEKHDVQDERESQSREMVRFQLQKHGPFRPDTTNPKIATSQGFSFFDCQEGLGEFLSMARHFHGTMLSHGL